MDVNRSTESVDGGSLIRLIAKSENEAEFGKELTNRDVVELKNVSRSVRVYICNTQKVIH